MITIAIPDSLFAAVKGFFDGDEEKTLQWFKAPNPLLGHIAPDMLLILGRNELLRQFIETQLAENEPPPLAFKDLKEWIDHVLDDAADKAEGEDKLGVAIECGVLRAHLLALRNHGPRVLKERHGA